jgi:NAD(P) transhydrogenase
VKVQLFPGCASFVDPHTIRVAAAPGATGSEKDVLLTADKVLIATGSTPSRPPEFPFADPRVHDSDDILNVKQLPRSLAVIGAGTIGSECACTFAALGCEVHLIDGRDELMPFLDREIAHALEKGMQRLGITFHWKERVTSCEAPSKGDVNLTLTSGAVVSVDQVLVAAGRESNTAELNLTAAGITAGKRGLLTVNGHFQTSTPHIYATGDVIGFPALASTSMEQARVAMFHAFDADFLKTAVSPLLPSGIYTIPEVSMLGETEQTAREKNIEYYVGRAEYRQNARGQIIGDDSGLLKLLFRKSDLRLIGVHVIGEMATEVVHIGLMAMLTECNLQIFNRACFNYPTLGDLYKQATYNMVRTHLRDGILQQVGQLRVDPAVATTARR